MSPIDICRDLLLPGFDAPACCYITETGIVNTESNEAVPYPGTDIINAYLILDTVVIFTDQGCFLARSIWVYLGDYWGIAEIAGRLVGWSHHSHQMYDITVSDDLQDVHSRIRDPGLHDLTSVITFNSRGIASYTKDHMLVAWSPTHQIKVRLHAKPVDCCFHADRTELFIAAISNCVVFIVNDQITDVYYTDKPIHSVSSYNIYLRDSAGLLYITLVGNTIKVSE